jgi:hypothetical protein
MQNQLMLHCGGKPASFHDLDLIPMPQETRTYKPVSHFTLANRIKTISQDLLTLKTGDATFTLESESYGLAKDGNQMFAVITFHNESGKLGLMIGFRNSYDKSMSLAICCGATVFICDNLCIRGEISFMGKHTLNIWKELEEKMVTTIYRSRNQYHQITADAGKLEQIPFPDVTAYRTLGELYGREIVSPRQLTATLAEWKKPRHAEFEPRTAWSFYNAVTESLKSSPPADVMERHSGLTNFFDANFIDMDYTSGGLWLPKEVNPIQKDTEQAEGQQTFSIN